MYQEQLWHGARELRWVPPLGVIGAATGAIAIGTVATSRSTTIIISIRTTILTATSIAKAAIGSTIHNTAATLHTAIEERLTNLAAAALAKPAIGRAKVLAIGRAAAEPERARAVAEQELQAGEPEPDQVVAELERDPVAARALVIVLEVAELERDLEVAARQVLAPRHGPAEVAVLTK